MPTGQLDTTLNTVLVVSTGTKSTLYFLDSSLDPALLDTYGTKSPAQIAIDNNLDSAIIEINARNRTLAQAHYRPARIPKNNFRVVE